MGKLVPKCIAANEESIYFVASGQNPSVNSETELVILAKSNPSPDLRNTTWTVVSTAPAEQFHGRQLIYNRQKFSCHVDKNGVFTIMAKSWVAADLTVYRTRYVPSAPLTSDSGTLNPNNSTHGEWIRANMIPPFEYWDTQRTWIHPETVAAAFIQYPSSGNKLPPSFKPTLEIGQMNEAGRAVSENPVKVNITDAVGVVYGKFYGDEQLYTTLKVGPPIQSNSTQGTTYNQTLVYFPFKAPYSLTSPPEGVASFPWNLDCASSNLDSDAKAAISKGKLYYFCEANTTSNMYIFDSATKENLGPYPLDVGVARETDVLLAPGPSGFPHYALINQTDGTISYTTFSAMTESGINATKLDSRFFTVASSFEEYVPKPPIKESQESHGTTAVIWGIVAAGCVSFMVLCFWSIHRYKRRQADNASVLPVDRVGAVHRPGEEEDFELPAYTSTPEYANYIHPEDLAYLQRVNNPNPADLTQGQSSNNSNNNNYSNPPTDAPPEEEGTATPPVDQTEGDAAGSEDIETRLVNYPTAPKDFMDDLHTFWPTSYGATDPVTHCTSPNSFWSYAWAKHGACVSTLEHHCLTNHIDDQDVYSARGQGHSSGIDPNAEDMHTAIVEGFKGDAQINCRSGALAEDVGIPSGKQTGSCAVDGATVFYESGASGQFSKCYGGKWQPNQCKSRRMGVSGTATTNHRA
ncbi:hypothetical protein BGZ82_011248 [Podila clonocystis]|nr:hypothetical protein BGZ82_011248 [Podila clonocystis]